MALRATGGDVYGELLEAGLRPRTVRSYMATIQAAEAWFRVRRWDLATATPEQIVAYAATKPRTFASQNLLRAALRRYWVLVGHPKPPLGSLTVPQKPRMVCKALEEEDARILAKAARGRGDLKGLAVLLGMYEGMRREEIATAAWTDFAAGWLTIAGKGERSRTIPIHPVVTEALAELPHLTTAVFPGRTSVTCSPATIWKWIREVADEAGVGLVKPHWLRHTCLATQNDNTGDLRAVQEFAGHSRPETTSGYTRATKRRLVAVALSVEY